MNNIRYFQNRKKSGPGWVERTGYGLGCMGISLIYPIITDYTAIYMTNVVMLDIAVISSILAVSRFFDGISDLTVGYIVDHTSSPLGKARSWLLVMCLPFALTAWLLFRVPGNWSLPAKYIYVFILYNLVFTVFFTFLQISSYSMVSLISGDKDEQGLLSVIQSAFSNIGILLSTPLFVKAMLYFSKDTGNKGSQQGYSSALMIYGIAMIILVVISVFTTRERVGATGESADAIGERAGATGERATSSIMKAGTAARPEKKADRLKELKTLLSDRYWRILTISQILDNVGVQCMLMGSSYYATYILNDIGQMTWMTAAMLIPSLLIKPVVPFVMRRIGKRQTIVLSYVVMAAASMGFALAAPWKPGMIIGNAIRGIGIGFVTGVQLGMVADLVRKTEEEKGVSAPGLGTAGFSTAIKIGRGLGSIFFGYAMAAAGFTAATASNSTAPPSQVTNVITAAYCWIPMIVFILLFIIYNFFFNYESNT